MDTKDFNIPKLNTYLNTNEIKEIEYLNSIAKKSNQSIKDRTEFGNLTVNEILERWADTNVKIFIDIVDIFSNLDKYNNILDDEQSNTIFKAILEFIRDFSQIFIKEKRAIYVGITMIIISILFYFIGITS